MTDPMDYYEEYSEWLMRNFPEKIHNGDSLLSLFEGEVGFEEFLEEREACRWTLGGAEP